MILPARFPIGWRYANQAEQFSQSESEILKLTK